MSNTLRPHGLQPTRLLHPWGFPGKSTGVGCHCLLLHISVVGILGAVLKFSLPLAIFGVGIARLGCFSDPREYALYLVQFHFDNIC